MVPVFKSDYSIGKSILTLNDPCESGPQSIFSLLDKHNQDSLCLVEDSLTGFLKAHSQCDKFGINLRFGLRISFCSDSKAEIPKGGDTTEYKIIIFAKNSVGCKLLNKIYSYAFTEGSGRIDSAYLKSIWSSANLAVAVPFYDSFLFYNFFTFRTCIMDFDFTNPTFFLEDNKLPFDSFLKDQVINYCENLNYNTIKTKSIYYECREDFSAYQTYKCICARSSFGRGSSLEKPNLDHCASQEFCMESWEENK